MTEQVIIRGERGAEYRFDTEEEARAVFPDGEIVLPDGELLVASWESELTDFLGELKRETLNAIAADLKVPDPAGMKTKPDVVSAIVLFAVPQDATDGEPPAADDATDAPGSNDG